MSLPRTFGCCCAILLLCARVVVGDEDRVSDATVISTIRKATDFYRKKVAVHGGYVYYYSVDLSERWGEGRAAPDQIWVQPPGTPTVGMAYLTAFRATGDAANLDAARDAAHALVFGQLRSGGWTNAIDCGGRRRGDRYSGGDRRRVGISSLDDGQTQSAIQLLALVDEALEFRDTRIHQSAELALQALLEAQFPNGGYPQVWTTSVEKLPVMKASYPDYDWRTEGRIKNYWDMYTTNDNVCGYVADALITAWRVYKEDKYEAALRRLGSFLISAQMPDPQPAWAQQYNYQMHPIWARRFEPPGIAGDESQEVIETLMKISIATRDAAYLEPIPRALAYLKRSILADGQLARYYELGTNKPLYMVRRGQQYTLTYNDDDLPKHYAWKIQSQLDELEQRYNSLKTHQALRGDLERVSQEQVRRIVNDLDDQGRWVSTYRGEPLVGQPDFRLNRQYVSSAVFSRNIDVLCTYLTESQRRKRD